MADSLTYYDSPLTGEELDEAFRKIPQIDASVEEAADSATLAESWAAGGTGTREGEDTDNARYWYEQAKRASDFDPLEYYTRAQADGLVPWLYKATFLADGWASGSGNVNQTVSLTAADGGPAVTANSTLLPCAGIDNALPEQAKQAMAGPACQIARAPKTLGAGTMTVTLDSAPAVDVELYFLIRQGASA